jgi:hypothetical protein
MPITIITSHHQLERDHLSDEEIAVHAPHRVRCLSCPSTPLMTIAVAQEHCARPARNPTPTLHRLFTIA